jgi:hypothetical protein
MRMNDRRARGLPAIEGLELVVETLLLLGSTRGIGSSGTCSSAGSNRSWPDSPPRFDLPMSLAIGRGVSLRKEAGPHVMSCRRFPMAVGLRL